MGSVFTVDDEGEDVVQCYDVCVYYELVPC